MKHIFVLLVGQVGDEERLKAVEEAYKVLSDPLQRLQYDKTHSTSEGVRVWRPGEYGHPALRPTSKAFHRKFGDGKDLDSVYAQLEKRQRERIMVRFRVCYLISDAREWQWD
jgi:curved DNA-binding protein CbpA